MNGSDLPSHERARALGDSHPRAARACVSGNSSRIATVLGLGAVLYALTGCAPSHKLPNVDAYPKVKYWEAFPLGLGKSAVFPDGLVVTFEDVLTPSVGARDSGGARPVTASVTLSLWTAEAVVDSLTLPVDPTTPGRGLCMGYEVEVRRLLAESQADEEIVKDDYWASLVIGKY